MPTSENLAPTSPSRRLEDYTEDQQRVLQHAADILKLSVAEVLSSRRNVPRPSHDVTTPHPVAGANNSAARCTNTACMNAACDGNFCTSSVVREEDHGRTEGHTTHGQETELPLAESTLPFPLSHRTNEWSESNHERCKDALQSDALSTSLGRLANPNSDSDSSESEVRHNQRPIATPPSTGASTLDLNLHENELFDYLGAPPGTMEAPSYAFSDEWPPATFDLYELGVPQADPFEYADGGDISSHIAVDQQETQTSIPQVSADAPQLTSLPTLPTDSAITSSHGLGFPMPPAPISRSDRDWESLVQHPDGSLDCINWDEVFGLDSTFDSSWTQGSQSVAEGVAPAGIRKSSNRKGRREKFADPARRRATAETRAIGACVGCHYRRIRCERDPTDPNGPCLQCRSPSVSRGLPCCRYKVSDARLYVELNRPRTEWTRRWTRMELTDIADSDWVSPEIKTIAIDGPHGVLTPTWMRVRQFRPNEGDRLRRVWTRHGKTFQYDEPPYALADMAELGRDIRRYCEDNVALAIERFVSHDALLYDTFKIAHAYSINQNVRALERNTVKSALSLWLCARFTDKAGLMTSEEKLGMQPQTQDPEDHTYGKYILPCIVRAQILIVMQVSLLLPMQREVRNSLMALIDGKDIKSWFAIYLTLFILLQNCALLNAYLKSKAEMGKTETDLQLKIAKTQSSFVRELHIGAHSMLYHFHYNNGGRRPFDPDWGSTTDIQISGLDDAYVSFLKTTGEALALRNAELEAIRSSAAPDHDLFFISQMYDRSWKPAETIPRK